MTNPASDACDQITEALEQDRLELPTLPEVAFKVRDVAEQDDVTIPQLCRVIEQDPALAVHLIKVANSPLFRVTQTMQDLHSAISRMGTQYSATLAIGLAMRQMFQATSEIIDRKLRHSWAHACDVAAVSGVITHRFTSLRKDQAVLAGLTHSIGSLPILTWAEHNPRLVQDSLTLQAVVDVMQGHLGGKILRSWNFPDEIAAIPEQYTNFDRNPKQPDLVDVVMASHLLTLDDGDHPHLQIAKITESAFDRLGFDPDDENGAYAELAGEISDARASFV
jgi:HD-like signal output (HDOD) protein